MANFVRLAETAKRLIDENGRAVSVVKFGNTPADSAKPWRGRRNVDVVATVTGSGVFVPMGELKKTIAKDEDGVLNENQYMLFAANDDGGVDLRDFDAVQDDGRTWKIKSVELIQPGALRILYQIEVER